MIENSKERKNQIYHCLNNVYINYLSTHCTFIYLPLKILKLLPTNYKPGKREHSEHRYISESELISKG